MIESPMSRMRHDEIQNTSEEFPPRNPPTGRWIKSPNDPSFVVIEPWNLDGNYDAYGERIT